MSRGTGGETHAEPEKPAAGDVTPVKAEKPGAPAAWEGGLWSGWCCLLPPLAGLLFFAFLAPQLLTGGWRLRVGEGETLIFKNLLTERPPAVERQLEAVLNRQIPLPTPAPKQEEKAEGKTNVKPAPDVSPSATPDAEPKPAPARNYTQGELNDSASAAGLVAWSFSTGLNVVVIAVGMFIAGLVLWHAPSADGRAARWGFVLIVFAVTAAVLDFALFAKGGMETSTRVTRQFLESIETHIHKADLVMAEEILTYLGYVMGLCLLYASGAVLWKRGRWGEASSEEPKGPAMTEASRLAAQMKYLRLLLYVGAVALVVTTLRARLNYRWALEYLPPLALFAKGGNELLAATILYQRLESLATNVVTAIAILNTVLLAAIYVPSSLILRQRAEEVAHHAMREEPASTERERKEAGAAEDKKQEEKEGKPARAERKTPDREEWMRAHGLHFPLKDHLGRIAAILSPLLAGPVAELLSLLKS